MAVTDWHRLAGLAVAITLDTLEILVTGHKIQVSKCLCRAACPRQRPSLQGHPAAGAAWPKSSLVVVVVDDPPVRLRLSKRRSLRFTHRTMHDRVHMREVFANNMVACLQYKEPYCKNSIFLYCTDSARVL